jgi:hypothetical protein
MRITPHMNPCWNAGSWGPGQPGQSTGGFAEDVLHRPTGLTRMPCSCTAAWLRRWRVWGRSLRWEGAELVVLEWGGMEVVRGS